MNAFRSSDPLLLMREDLHGFVGYRSARSESVRGDAWLNANEACDRSSADPSGAVRRYPSPQPEGLVARLARLYGCDPARLLVGRGSDEAIDLLVRAFCAPSRDAVLATPPVFGMYAVSARLHGARVVEAPLFDDGEDFRIDFDAVAQAAVALHAKLVFLCSPGNPAGGVAPREAVVGLARRLDGRALVIVDEAYVEFAEAPALVREVAALRNLVVLRTLSKAHALAGARIGCAIADPDVIAALRRCQAPYPIPASSAEVAVAALSPTSLETTASRITATKQARDRLRESLRMLPGVRRVYPSQANFLLVRFADAEGAWRALCNAGIVVRDMRAMPRLHDALRITIGTADENARLLAALRGALA
ncbi:Histidinol-phosphate aminotransferase [Lysobacter dokdonensis DS-58]|uniref:Histidinol-phosphate aminotransferase n=1 Tax=Lysobacter dokdonensis DS-58 TaxID=1300345 RepID=A0A0A2WE40_9GAMM|nr:histidinol-phosphate transaminase [Lysobacter dokdonensis]KGQ18476.1 Histidinol-phosphate aminotransferase [Lysobacter dokdonensis DS-58]